VQTRRGRTTVVPGQQLADHRLRRHLLTGADGRPDRLIAGPQSAGMGQRHTGRPASTPANTTVALPAAYTC